MCVTRYRPLCRVHLLEIWNLNKWVVLSEKEPIHVEHKMMKIKFCSVQKYIVPETIQDMVKRFCGLWTGIADDSTMMIVFFTSVDFTEVLHKKGGCKAQPRSGKRPWAWHFWLRLRCRRQLSLSNSPSEPTDPCEIGRYELAVSSSTFVVFLRTWPVRRQTGWL